MRGKELHETRVQYWNPKNSPRFFAMTCDMVGDAFSKLKDIRDDFNYIFATARHISAKIREELQTIDREQWAALPAERQVVEPASREKAKAKTRKLNKDFNLEDFLKFYGLGVDNVAKNTRAPTRHRSPGPVDVPSRQVAMPAARTGHSSQ